ncbi:LYR motif-containing protein 9 [Biomphalaria glabrata]|nr:LYR motif-containing protein 9 [Biomphalaria glabrata]
MTTKTPLQLYKYLLRVVKKLPPDAQPYYKHHIKQAFKSHEDETDKERIAMIIERAIEDAAWVLEKYLQKKKK